MADPSVELSPERVPKHGEPQRTGGRARALAASVTTVAIETAISWTFLDRRLADIVMVFLLGVVAMAVGFGYVASLTATALSIVALDFFFTAPYLSFTVEDHRHYLTFLIMAFVAIVISSQTERIRREAAGRVRLAMDRMRLAEEAEHAQVEVQKERLRNALLSSVSHDLRTPLAVIKGAATGLLEGESSLDPARRRAQLITIADEASRLDRLVRNLVDMTSVEAGSLRVRKEWQPLEEVIGVALGRLEDQLADRPIEVDIEDEASFAPFDAILLGQVFLNLVENATKYTPPAARIAIRARAVTGGVEVEVADWGPGVPPGQEERIFEKFYRAASTGIGMGVGLTICRGILAAHDGRIGCVNRPEGGASFTFFLPAVRTEPSADPLPEPSPEP